MHTRTKRPVSLTTELRGIVMLCLLAFSGAATGVAPVEVVALFKDRAVLRTTAGQEMLRAGETSPGGVTLLSADPEKAKVRYGGREYTLQLTARVGSVFVEPETNAVRINRDSVGQYRIRGAIDAHMVDFLVDTGASIVAISERQATAMGLSFMDGRPGQVQTAQGTAPAFFITLDKVTVGGITIHGVQATVIQGNFPTDVLLGMSFLNQVDMQDSQGVLTLTARY